MPYIVSAGNRNVRHRAVFFFAVRVIRGAAYYIFNEISALGETSVLAVDIDRFSAQFLRLLDSFGIFKACNYNAAVRLRF